MPKRLSHLMTLAAIACWEAGALAHDGREHEAPDAPRLAQRPVDRGGRGGRGQGQRNPGGGRGNARQSDPSQPPPFHTEVPEHSVDVILGRPTASSVTLSIVSYDAAEGYVTYGTTKADLKQRSRNVKLPARAPVELILGPLERDAEYYYPLHRKVYGGADFVAGEMSSFHTQRSVGEPFTFTIQAPCSSSWATTMASRGAVAAARRTT